MNKLYSLIVCLAFLQTSFGQVATNYNAKWFFGVNTGLTWQTTDVDNKTKTGWGLTLGKSFNYHTGSLISFDIRGRFLRGFWYGQDRKISDFTTPNTTLSQGATNYLDTLGYAVHNFQAENYLLNLELVAHANRLRERTRWDAYIFAGIGLNWKQTYGDYLNRDQTTGDLNLYNWDATNLSKSALKNLQDGVYETALDGSSQTSFNFFTSSSLGFGLGYQVAKAVTIGAEHKTTFTNIDDFDGFIAQGKYKNDIYHYTNAFIRFRLFGGRDREEVYTPTPQPVEERLPPTVQFTQPSISGTEVSNPNYYVQAKIKNVFDKDNVIFTLNGTRVTNFTYNTRSDLFASNIALVEGQNTLILTGNNQYGTDTKTTIIIYKRELILPPVVNFIQPSVNPTTVANVNYTVIGNVMNVKDRTGVSVVVNGSTRNDFSFDANNGNVTLDINLNPGSNTVQITGTNPAGTDSKSTVIVFNRAEPVKTPPVVFFTDPGTSPVNVGNNTYTIRGKIMHVNNASGVSLTQNGSVKSNFIFDPNTNDFTYSASLDLNQNTFVLTGTNNDGSANASTVLVYQRTVVNPPVVTIYSPNTNSTTVNSPQFNFGGSVTNVSTQNQITLLVNGSPMNNFGFNSATGGVNATLNLNPGTNTIQLTGTNADGTDSKQVNVVYTPAVVVERPIVYFTNPSVSPTSVSTNSYTLQGKILHVDGSQNVTFKRNGLNQSNFSYNANTNNFTSTVTLNPGQNIFEITGTNTAGTASATTIIALNVAVPRPPIVTISSPNSTNTNVSNAQFAFVGNVQNVNAKSQVSLTVNGVLLNGFNFNSATGTVTASLALNSGTNTVMLSGTNSDGTDSKTVAVVYSPAPAPKPPVVTISSPSGTTSNTSSAQFAFVGNIQNITTRSQVSMMVNGSMFNGFNYTASTGSVTADLTLVSGSNTIVLKGTNLAGTDSKLVTVIYTPVVTLNPPVVNFVQPATSPAAVSSPSYQVKATVANVSSPSGVTIKHNGNNVSVFTFGSNNLSFNLSLVEGANLITVTGTNTSGVDTKSTNIVYTKPTTDPLPVVTFINPAISGTTVAQPTYEVRATVLNVVSSQDISIKANGLRVGKFDFSAATKVLTFSVGLTAGSNTVEVTGTNASGKDEKSTTIIYKAPPCDKPVINLINPSLASSKTDQNTITLTASIEGISSASQITLKPNGGRTIPFEYNASTKTITANVSLAIGTNNILLQATNDCGSASATYTITRAACDAPNMSLNFANVPHNQSTLAPKITLLLNTVKVVSSSQVSVTLNSKAIPSTFNLANNTIEVDYGIQVGTSTFQITVTNDCGTKTYTHTVTRVKSPTKNVPTVVITDPASSPTSVTTNSYTLKFTTTEIVDQGEIIVRVNGTPVKVNFNKTSNSSTAVIPLNTGSNSVNISVTNPVGTASDATVLITTGKSSGSSGGSRGGRIPTGGGRGRN